MATPTDSSIYLLVIVPIHTWNIRTLVTEFLFHTSDLVICIPRIVHEELCSVNTKHIAQKPNFHTLIIKLLPQISLMYACNILLHKQAISKAKTLLNWLSAQQDI